MSAPSTWIAFHVTDRCQLACRHCLRDPGRGATDLPVETVARLLDEAHRVYRCDHAGLTGGEPILHPGLDRIIDAIVAAGYDWHIVTSGRGFARLLALLDAAPRRRETLTCVDLSLDGSTAEIHDSIRGEGSHREVMTAAAACAARGIRFTLQAAVNAVNRHEIEAIGLAASQLGAHQVAFGMTLATGSPHDADLALPAAGWRDVQDRVRRLGDTLRLPVVEYNGFHQRQPLPTCPSLRGEVLYVDQHGRLVMCCQHADLPGPDDRVAVDLGSTSLASAHRQLLKTVHEYLDSKLQAAESGGLESPWDQLPCNHCLAHFGKPHWSEEGSAGPRARRARALRPVRPDGES